MQNSQKNILADVEAISKISAISNILEIVCASTGMGFSAVTRVTSDRWIACAVNDKINFGILPGGELKLETTICKEIRQHQKPVAIDQVAYDALFADHPTPKLYGFQSYISVPIILKNGSFFGTLCAIDPQPAKINNPEIIGTFTMFADLIAFHLDAIEQLERSQKRLQKERKNSEIREQFIAILGHDLRNPIHAISNSAALLDRNSDDDRTRRLVSIIKDSSFRMKGLVENIMDFASGRLGLGISVIRTNEADVKAVIIQVVDEMKAVWPDRKIKLNLDLKYPVYADSKRMGQLFANLLGNALTYSAENSTVEITAISNAAEFNLCVANEGKMIPVATMKRLFLPFSRGEVEATQKGLGLGLFIASEIANAHDGKLSVSSTDIKTSFTFIIPRAE